MVVAPKKYLSAMKVKGPITSAAFLENTKLTPQITAASNNKRLHMILILFSEFISTSSREKLCHDNYNLKIALRKEKSQ